MKNYFDNIFENNFKLDNTNGVYHLDDQILSSNKILSVIETMKNDGTEEIAQVVFNKFGKNNIKKIVVLGSGSGKMGNHLSKYFPKSTIYEVDKSSPVIDRLTNKFKGHKYRIAILGDAMDIPVKRNSIDLIVAYSVLRYIDDKKKVINSVNKIIKTGGSAVFVEARVNNVIRYLCKILREVSLEYKTVKQNNISLTRTSFFYYLIQLSKKDSGVKQKINMLKKRKGISFYEAALESAGTYLGSLYYTFYKKND